MDLLKDDIGDIIDTIYESLYNKPVYITAEMRLHFSKQDLKIERGTHAIKVSAPCDFYHDRHGFISYHTAHPKVSGFTSTFPSNTTLLGILEEICHKCVSNIAWHYSVFPTLPALKDTLESFTEFYTTYSDGYTFTVDPATLSAQLLSKQYKLGDIVDPSAVEHLVGTPGVYMGDGMAILANTYQRPSFFAEKRDNMYVRTSHSSIIRDLREKCQLVERLLDNS